MADYVSALNGVQMDNALLDMAEHTSEAYAVGERNGVPVDEYDVTYENNAKYYAELASSVITGDVTNAVRWDVAQSLTETAKATARGNIDVPTPASSAPLMDGTAAVGTSVSYARQDHVHPTDTSRAAASHEHSASDVTSGTLGVARGGTGASSFTANSVVMSNTTTTGALTTRSVTNNTSSTAVPANTNIPTCNTVKYGLDNRLNRTAAVNAADTGYTGYKARGEALFTTDTNPTVNGTISWTYE